MVAGIILAASASSNPTAARRGGGQARPRRRGRCGLVLVLLCVLRSACGVECAHAFRVFGMQTSLSGVGAASVEWPQWGGPGRDFKSGSKGLAARWPAGGPRKVWTRPLGEGHSSIVADGGSLYTMYRKGDDEYVVALDAATGRTLWEHAYAAPLLPRMDASYGIGPHSSPLVAGGLVCAVGMTGRLKCLDKSTGRVAWAHDLWGEYGGTKINVGYSSSPIAYGNMIVAQVGGAGHALMAFDRRDGRVVWSRHDFRNSSSSPIIIEVDGREQLIAFMHNEVVGLDPASGELRWTHPISAGWDFHFNISTPVWGEGNMLFVAAAYGIGGRVLQLSNVEGRTRVRELWQSERARVHKENAIRVGDVVYASTGHMGPAFLTAMDVRTGKVLWQDRSFSHASLLYADGKFIILDEDGTLGLATPSPAGLSVHSRAHLTSGPSWTVPTLVGTTLYVRDRKSITALILK